MTLDDKGREGVFAFLQRQGYTGTLKEWWAEVHRQSYLSEVRIAQTIWVPSLGSEHKAAQQYLNKLMAVIAPRFDAITSHTTYNLDFHFYKKSARRREQPTRPLRVSGIAIDIERREGYVNVRIQAYVDTEFRRDWNIRFKPGQQGQYVK